MTDTKDNYQTIGQLPARVPTVGEFLGQVAGAGVQADSMVKDAALHRIQAICAPGKDGKVPSVDLAAGIEIPEVLTGKAGESLAVKFSVPQLVYEPDRMLAIASLTADWNMTIHSTAVDATNLKAHETIDTTENIGWGPFSLGSVHIAAQSSQSESSKRTTDDTATLAAHMEMAQLPVSEGAAMIMSSMRRALAKGMEVVEKLTDAHVEDLKRRTATAVPAADGGALPAGEPPAGDDSGDSGDDEAETGTGTQTDDSGDDEETDG